MSIGVIADHYVSESLGGFAYVASAVSTGAAALTIPAATKAGDLLILSHTGGSFPATPTGWTLLGQNAGSYTGFYNRASVFYRFATASDGGSTVTLAVGGAEARTMDVWRGAGTPALLGSNGGASNKATAPAGTTTVADSMVTRLFSSRGGAHTLTVDTPLTATVTAPANTQAQIANASEQWAVVGAVPTRTATLTASQSWSAFTVQIPPA